MTVDYVLGVDIGGTNMNAAVVRRDDGRIVGRGTAPTESRRGIEDGLDRLIRLIETVERDAGVEDDAIAGIGIGCAGPLDTERGLVQNPYTLPGWEDMPLVAGLTARFGRPVVLLNDADAAALGEFWTGAGRGTRSMMYITISTGIGGGLVLDGRLYHGLASNEVGHMVLDAHGPPCYCQARGCWEMLAAGPAIAAAAQARAADDSPLIALAGSREAITARHVGQAADAGDPLALALLRETGEWLAIGIGNLINLLAPELFVLGGGVMQSARFIMPALHEAMAGRILYAPMERIRIVTAELGLNAGVIGAARGLLASLDGQA